MSNHHYPIVTNLYCQGSGPFKVDIADLMELCMGSQKLSQESWPAYYKLFAREMPVLRGTISDGKRIVLSVRWGKDYFGELSYVNE